MTTENQDTGTWTLIQRDEFGDAVNTITGLNEASANDLADVLRLGDAHQGERPWKVELVRELTPTEKTAQAATKWRENSAERCGALYKASHIKQVLWSLAADLDQLGEMDLPSTILTVKIQVCGGMDTPASDQIAAVAAIAAVLGQSALHYPTLVEGNPTFYGTGHSDLMVVTTAREPKPLVSDETIRQAEEIGKRYPDGINYVPPEHGHAGGAAGGPGENEAECACGTAFTGFDTYGEAMAMLDKHIADANAQVQS